MAVDYRNCFTIRYITPSFCILKTVNTGNNLFSNCINTEIFRSFYSWSVPSVGKRPGVAARSVRAARRRERRCGTTGTKPRLFVETPEAFRHSHAGHALRIISSLGCNLLFITRRRVHGRYPRRSRLPNAYLCVFRQDGPDDFERCRGLTGFGWGFGC